METKKAVIIVGHGGVPKDFPREKVGRLNALESMRRAAKKPQSDEEIALDSEIRNWPRTRENEPYHFGILAIAEAVKAQFIDVKVVVAYNEYCAPSLGQAVRKLIEEQYTDITLVTTMFTRGGVHSEFEIPEEVEQLSKQYPNASIKYAWPFDVQSVAGFLVSQLRNVA